MHTARIIFQPKLITFLHSNKFQRHLLVRYKNNVSARDSVVLSGAFEADHSGLLSFPETGPSQIRSPPYLIIADPGSLDRLDVAEMIFVKD